MMKKFLVLFVLMISTFAFSQEQTFDIMVLRGEDNLPTTNLNGGALRSGSLAFKSNEGRVYQYDGSSWERFAIFSELSDSQQLSLANNILSLESGGTADLSSYLDNTDSQQLSLANNILSLDGSTSADLSSYLDNTDGQTITDLSLAGNTLSITLSGGNTQNIDLSSLSTGGGTTYTPSNGITFTGNAISVDQPALTDLHNDARAQLWLDALYPDVANLSGTNNGDQDISIIGDQITLSNGSTITVPSVSGTEVPVLTEAEWQDAYNALATQAEKDAFVADIKVPSADGGTSEGFGPNIIPNPYFDNANDWFRVNSTITGGRAVLTVPSGSSTSIYTPIVLDDPTNPEDGYETGETYQLDFDITAGTDAVGKDYIVRDKSDGLGSINTIYTINAGTETVSLTFPADAISNAIMFARATTASYEFFIDNVILRKVVSGTSSTTSTERWNSADVVIFGTSITSTAITDRWPDTFDTIVSPQKITNVAVSGQKITWDATTTETTVTGVDANVNNRLWNSIQYWESIKTTEPTSIIIDHGTNDNAQVLGSYIDAFAQDEASTDHLTMANAFRKALHYLRLNYPTAQILYVSPIQSKTGGRDYTVLSNIRNINFSICDRYAVETIDALNGSNISDEFEPVSAAGQDTYDGVHTNANGARKLGEYISQKFKTLYRK